MLDGGKFSIKIENNGCGWDATERAIKMAPWCWSCKTKGGYWETITVTAQHRQMLDQVLETFNIVPDHDLICEERPDLY